ncbi:hypothetical protein FHW96_004153, partial [Novosphingobium sp. SG751A]|nr:hypothetical protein [Novosphingobium sp. SG751A]
AHDLPWLTPDNAEINPSYTTPWDAILMEPAGRFHLLTLTHGRNDKGIATPVAAIRL